MTPVGPPAPTLEAPTLLRRLAVANVVVNVLIVLTGGLVRLTGSGLGCPTWPRCTAESVVPTQELAIHGAIEFGNRLITFVVGAAALAFIVAAWRSPAGRAGRPTLLVPALVLLLGGLGHILLVVLAREDQPVAAGTALAALHLIPAAIDVVGLLLLRKFVRASAGLGSLAVRPSPLTMGIAILLGVSAQAVLGGVTVRTGLNPWTVSAHFALSALLIAISLTAWNHLQYPAGARVVVVPPGLASLTWLTAVAGSTTVVLGTVVTGSGPHSGDPDALRTGFDLEQVSQLHADAVFAFLGLALGMWLASRDVSGAESLHRSAGVLVVVLLLQGTGGFVEYFSGIPIGLVILHLLGAAITVLALTWVVHTSRTFGAVSVDQLSGGAVTISAGRG